MAKKQITNYKFVPGFTTPDTGLYPNAVALIEANKAYLIQEMAGYIYFGSHTPGSAPTTDAAAIALLTSNKNFIKEEANAWILDQIASNESPFVGYTYTTTIQDKCKRDIGYLVDAFISDLTGGGNAETIRIGRTYWRDGVAQLVSPTQETAVYTFVKTLINSFVLTKTTYPSLQSVANQVISGGTPNSGIARVDALIDIIITLIPNGLTSLPGITYNYNSTFVGYTYNSAKCLRDTEYVIDSYLYDLTCGGNSASVYISSKYYISGVLQIQTPQVEILAHTFIKNLINNYVLDNHLFPSYNTTESQVTLSNAGETSSKTKVTTLSNIVVNALSSGLGSIPTSIAPFSADGSLLANTVGLIEANKRFIQEEAIAYISYNVANNIAPFAYFTYDSAKCKRDVSYIIEGYLSDLKHGGNRQTVFNASKYFENGVPQVDGSRAPEISTHTFIKTLIQNFVLTNTPFTNRQAVITQVIDQSFNAELTGVARVGLLANIITDVITNGPISLPTIQSSRGYVKFPGLVKSRDILLITNTTRNIVLYNFTDETAKTEVTTSSSFDADFPGALYGTDTISTVTFEIDTSSMMVTDSIQIFVEAKEQAVRLNPANTDAMERMKVGIPQSMLDADFEYGLQPTKWQAISLMRNYPSVYEIPGSDISVLTVVTDASSGTGGSGASAITVTTFSSHGFAVGDPFTIKALANSVSGFSRAEGTFLVATAPTLNTFTYYAKSKVGTINGQQLSSTYTQLRRAGFYTGASIGIPQFSVYSNGSTGTITTSLNSLAGVDVIGFTGTVPPIGAPLSGTGINSGTQVTAVTGPGGTAATTTLVEYAPIGSTAITVDSTTGISAGLVFDRGDGTAVNVTNVVGNVISLGGALTSAIIGSTQTYTTVTPTGGTGASAVFSVSRNGASYSTSITTAGTGYVANDILTVAGTDLGGTSPVNDATVTVLTASPLNGVDTLDSTTLVGGSGYIDGVYNTTGGAGQFLTVNVSTTLGVITAVTVADAGQEYAVADTITITHTLGKALTTSTIVPGTGYASGNNVTTTGGNGTGLIVNIVDDGLGGVASVVIVDGGSGYSVNDVVTIDGGNSDATFVVDTVSTSATIDVLTIAPGGLIQTVSTSGTPITAPSKNFTSAFTISDITTAPIATGNTGITFSAISTIQVTFTGPHGFVPGDTITVQITSSDTGAQLAAGPYFVEQVPSTTTIRYTARASGAINNTLTGNIYGRPDSFFVHRPFDGGVQLGTASPSHGATAIRMSKKYIRYQSGKGVMYNTGALFAPSYDLKSLTATGTTVGSVITISTDDTDHGCQVGGGITIIGVQTAGYNGNYTVVDIINERVLTVIASQTLGDTNAILGDPCIMSVRSWHGSTVRSGIFDDQNGMFWQFDGQRMAVVKRSSTFQVAGTISVAANSNAVTGSGTRFSQQLSAGDRVVIRGMSHVVTQVLSDTSLSVAPDYRGVSDITNVKMVRTIDLIVPQENWNLDPLNGSGPSGYNIDVTKMQMIGIQHTWYGAGFIDFMLRGPDGNYCWAHRFRNSNVNTEAYMRTGNQPVRYEVINEGAKDKLSSAMTDVQTTIPLTNAYWFPSAGTVIIDSEVIRYTGNTGTTLTGCVRAASLTQFVAGSQRNFTGSPASTHSIGTGVILISNTITPNISHWGSAFLIDGQFDSDRGYIFNYASTAISASLEKNTAFLIRLAPSVSNAQIGDLGEKELLNRAQLLLTSIACVSDGVSSADPFAGNTWSSGGTATSGQYYTYTSAGIKNWYQATSSGTFSATAPVFGSGTGASGTYGVNLTWAGTTPNNAGAIVVEGVLNPSNYPTDPTKITWTGLASSAAGGQPSFAQIASGGSVTWSGAFYTATSTVQGAFTTTLTAKSFAPATNTLTAVAFSTFTRSITATSFAPGTSALYNSAFSASRSDFLITDTAYDVINSQTPLAINDTLSVATYLTSGQKISGITRSYINLGGVNYTRIVMNLPPNATSTGAVTNGQYNISVVATANIPGIYSSALSTARTDFLVTQTQLDSASEAVTDVLSATTYIVSGQSISSITNNYTLIGGIAYARVIMTGTANVTSGAGTGNNVTVTATSAATSTYGPALSTARTDFLITDTQYDTLGIAIGDILSIATYITASQTITAINRTYINIGGTNYTRIVMSSVANASSVSGSGNDQTVTVTAAGTAASYTRTNYLYFTSASWIASGASVGTKVATDQTVFPAGTSVAAVTTRTYGATTIYRATFTQTSNATISASATLKYQFGAAYALPGEQVFSFITNPGSTDSLDLSPLKELTATVLGGRGAFPNGPDVLAINIYKVSGATTPANLILRWSEAQA